MSDEFKMGTGQAHELALAFSRSGWTNADVKILSEGDMLVRLLPVIRGQAEVKPLSFPSLVSACDLIPQGWTIVEDVAPTLKSASGLGLVSFLESGESRIIGTVLRERAITLKANFGLVDAKYLLDHQLEIQTEFRSNVLVFAGTLLRGSDGGLRVACLCWDGDHWYLNFDWLGSVWSGGDRLPRCQFLHTPPDVMSGEYFFAAAPSFSSSRQAYCRRKIVCVIIERTDLTLIPLLPTELL
ncbi:MAG: hypothetical protein HZC05_03195 [Candidatus Magasanikbacteria bacterium]|nr:hypothetical protein [Candidatus Magasanikbacteria bacterium]